MDRFLPQFFLQTINALKLYHQLLVGKIQFRRASFNPLFLNDEDGVGWVSPYHFGINEGPTLLMIENHRTGLIWSLMRRCKPLQAGLRLAGFQGVGANGAA